MVGEPSMMYIIRLVTEKVEQLGVHNGDNKVEGIVCVGDDDEHGCLPVPDHVELHFVVAHDLPKLRDVEWREPRSAGNQN